MTFLGIYWQSSSLQIVGFAKDTGEYVIRRWFKFLLQKMWLLTGDSIILVVLVTAVSMLWQQAEAQGGKSNFVIQSPQCERAIVQSSEPTKPVLTLLATHRGDVFSAAFSPDGTRIVTANGDATASVWDGRTGQRLMELKGHTYTVIKAVFSPDGGRIVTASADRTARLWDAKAGNELQILAGPATQPNNPPFTQEIQAAAFSADGARIITASLNGTAWVWDVQTGKLLLVLEGQPDVMAPVNIITIAAFSPNGARILTSCGDNMARLWNAETGDQVAELKGHKNQVWNATFSADGTRIVTVSNYAVQLWRVPLPDNPLR